VGKINLNVLLILSIIKHTAQCCEMSLHCTDRDERRVLYILFSIAEAEKEIAKILEFGPVL
jgi:hypothetical protein